MMERTKTGDVHVVVMQNGQNMFDLDFLGELNEQFDAVEAEAEGPAGLVLVGEGKFFSNGLNLEYLMGADAETRKTFGKRMLSTIRRLLVLPVPTVAALNGHAFAGGAFFALACDFRIQREDRGWICVSEVDAGVPIGEPMMRLVQGKVPPGTAREAVLTGKRYAADDAITAGMVDAKAPESELIEAATRLAAPVAAKERRIFTALKKELYATIADSFDAAIEAAS